VTRQQGITVITSTNKPDFMRNLFMNYRSQRWGKKELIVILNNDSMNIEKYKHFSRAFDQVSIYQLPGKTPLGVCLNYGLRKAKYAYIAKFDDDDYYAPRYLAEAMWTFKHTGADIVGKNKFYMFFQGRKKLYLATKPSKNSIAGATIMFKKKVFPSVKFSRLRVGSDMWFLRDCLRKGYKLRSSSQYYFAAIRRANQKTHTWKISHKTYSIFNAKQIAQNDPFRRIVSRH